MKKYYFLVRLSLLGALALPLVPLSIVNAMGEWRLGNDPSYSSFLVYIDLGLALVLFIAELCFCLFSRKRYEGFFIRVSQRDTLAERIFEIVSVLVLMAGLILLISSLLTTLSGDMIYLSAILIAYGGLGLVYLYMNAAKSF